MHDAATHAATHDDSKGQYFWVWGALLVLTAIEVVLGYKQSLLSRCGCWKCCWFCRSSSRR